MHVHIYTYVQYSDENTYMIAIMIPHIEFCMYIYIYVSMFLYLYMHIQYVY